MEVANKKKKKDKRKTPQRLETFPSTKDASVAAAERQPVTWSAASPRRSAAAVALAGQASSKTVLNVSGPDSEV